MQTLTQTPMIYTTIYIKVSTSLNGKLYASSVAEVVLTAIKQIHHDSGLDLCRPQCAHLLRQRRCAALCCHRSLAVTNGLLGLFSRKYRIAASTGPRNMKSAERSICPA